MTDFNFTSILGPAISSRGLSDEDASSLIEAIYLLIENSELAYTRAQFDEKFKELNNIAEAQVQKIEALKVELLRCPVEECMDWASEYIYSNLKIKVCPRHSFQLKEEVHGTKEQG